jgi:hypothetical protein
MMPVKPSVPVVSVVIPTYNRAHLLPRALDSALAQTHQDLEIVVVDDGSTDATAGIVQGYADPRVRLIRLAGRSGVSRARNAGIEVARGEWVAFLDSDDEWRPAKLEMQLARVAGEGRAADVVYCVRLIEDHVTGRAWPHRGPLHEGLVFEALLGGGWTPPSSLVMVRRTALAAVGGFDEALPSFEDYDLWLRLAQAGYRFAAVDAVLVVKHRDHGPQITRDHRARALGARRLDEKWGAVIRERLGPAAHRAWLDGRLTALSRTQLMRVRAAVVSGDRALAWRLCRAMWWAPWALWLRFGTRAVAITLLGRRAHGALGQLRRMLPVSRRPSR